VAEDAILMPPTTLPPSDFTVTMPDDWATAEHSLSSPPDYIPQFAAVGPTTAGVPARFDVFTNIGVDLEWDLAEIAAAEVDQARKDGDRVIAEPRETAPLDGAPAISYVLERRQGGGPPTRIQAIWSQSEVFPYQLVLTAHPEDREVAGAVRQIRTSWRWTDS
jgi:hypothetical protein